MRVRVALEAAVVAAAATLAVVDLPASGVERWFSLRVYPAIQHLVTPLSNLVPFAWLDILLVGGGAALLFAAIRQVRGAWRARDWRPVARGAWRLAAVGAAGYLVFLSLWGFNYRRVPMTQRIVLDRPAPSTEAVVQLGLDAVAHLNDLHEAAHRTGWRDDLWRDEPLRQAFASTQRLLSDGRGAVPGRLKASVLGYYFRWASVDGMVNPFGLEVLGNPDLLPFERPFVLAHEWAHLAGYADESEANFVGFLTTVRGNAAAQYSGWMFAYWQVSGELRDAERRAVSEQLADGPRRDLTAVYERFQRGQLPVVRRAGWAVYDQYLKANRVEAGIRSYGAVLTLLLRARFTPDWTPVRR